MVTILDALSGISAYPIPLHAIERVAEMRGLSLSSEFSGSVGASAEYRLAEADLYEWLSMAPDINVGGQSYSLTDVQRELFGKRAGQLRAENGAQAEDNRVKYGYKGSRL
jgi:hypothetical protein